MGNYCASVMGIRVKEDIDPINAPQPYDASYESYRTQFDNASEREAMLDRGRELQKKEPSDGTRGCCCCRCSPFACLLTQICCIGCWSIVLFYVLAILIIYFGVSNDFQLWALQQPENLVVKLLLPPVEIAESLACGQTQKLSAMQYAHGYNYAHAGMIWLTAASDIEQEVLAPQKRTWQLGEHPLISSHMPSMAEGRNVFPLALSDTGAGGSGAHEAYVNCFKAYLLGAAMDTRFKDATAQSLITQLVAEYKTTAHELNTDEFWTSSDKGLLPFTIKYLHYVCFGLDPNNAENYEILKAWYDGSSQMSYYLDPFGWAMGSTADVINRVADLYEVSPAFANFQVETQYDSMTKRELAMMCTSIFRLAGVQGFKQSASIVLGAWPLAGQAMYPASPEVNQFDQRSVLDTLDLSNTDEVLDYITECTRLDSPVSVTHRVLTEPLTHEFGDHAITFPAGTKVAIPLALGNVDEALWGSTSYQFDMKRDLLHSKYMSFNSIGTQSGGRECPGKWLTQQALIKLVQQIGQARRDTAR
mmetsp:Transcript_5427/g.9700  ORF Transcript_5427/g.9700 Transcript_5427/m.9700 type:complete len:532 (+) Transcript_5427:103-1698(+)